MDARTLLAAALAIAMMSMTVSLFAAENAPDSTPKKSEPIYGYRMMTPQERDDFRQKMRDARSADERQALRDEHRKQMEARAQERGVTLPEPRGGRGPGYGPRGGGRGPGSGPRGACAAGEECPQAGAGKGPGYGPRGTCAAGEACPQGGPGKGPGYGPRRDGKGPGYGKGPGGPRGDCTAGQNCPAVERAPAAQ